LITKPKDRQAMDSIQVPGGSRRETIGIF